MIPFDNRGRATIHGAAATYVYANPSQAEVGVGQPQAYAANRASFLNLQQETSLAVSIFTTWVRHRGVAEAADD